MPPHVRFKNHWSIRSVTKFVTHFSFSFATCSILHLRPTARSVQANEAQRMMGTNTQKISETIICPLWLWDTFVSTNLTVALHNNTDNHLIFHPLRASFIIRLSSRWWAEHRRGNLFLDTVFIFGNLVATDGRHHFWFYWRRRRFVEPRLSKMLEVLQSNGTCQ